MTRQSNESRPLMIAALVGAAAYAAGTLAVRWSRRFDFRGKVVLITGGSRGLGLVLARQFAEAGARVAIIGRDPDTLRRASDELAGRGADAFAIECDMRSQQDVNRAVEDVMRRFGRIDVLVNNAGTITVGPMETMTLADYEEAMRTHFYGPLYATLAVLPHLRKQGTGGRIVNISSIGGKVAVPHLLPYSASKFALTGFSEGLRSELLKDGIYVTTVCPGLMRTGSHLQASFKGRHREEFAWFSVMDSMPALTSGSVRAARQIISACRDGRAELILTIPGKMAAKAYALFPGFSTQIAGMVNASVLPKLGGIGQAQATGEQSESAITRSWITGLSRAEARANNELG